MSALRVLAAGLFFLKAATAAWGVGLQVSPVRLQFGPEQQAQALLLNNNGPAALNAQVRVMRWSQREQQDVLEPQDLILASPAIVRVEPGRPQTVRLVRSRISPADTEQSFRVLVDELPAAASPEPAAQSGLQLLLRYSIPVFVAAKAEGANTAAGKSRSQRDASALGPDALLAQLKAQLRPMASAGSRLELRNEGLQALRISQLRAVLSDGQVITLSEGLLGYVLPGQTMGWSFEQRLPPGVVLEAQLNDDPGLQRLLLQDAGH